MNQEAERLAIELTEDVEGFPEPTQLEKRAAAFLRAQAKEIEALKATANTCGSGAGCLHKMAVIEAQEADLEDLQAHNLALLADVQGCQQQARDAQSEMYVWIAENEALRVSNDNLVRDLDAAMDDAKRYRHIKSMARAMSLDINGNHYWTMQLRDVRGSTLDNAIDAAMPKEETKC